MGVTPHRKGALRVREAVPAAIVAPMSHDSLPGQTLANRYQVLEKIGEEMLGRVYKARDLQSDRLVSLKVLHPYLTENVEKVRRFAREITVTSSIRHPNTVQVLDYGEHGAQHFFVLEYLRGTPLEDLLKEGPLPFERAVAVAAQIASAMDAAHAQGAVHRNLNPQNVLLLDNAQGDYVKVRDFGLSKLDSGDDGDGHDLTGTGARIGNANYMAPEYIEDGQVSAQSDLYSLGCLLYHMLTGKTPFEGRPGQVLMMHISNRAEHPSRVAQGVPSWVDKVVAHLMDKEPKRRPHRGRVVVGALEQGIGRSLEPPELQPLDRDGEIVVRSLASKRVAVNGKTVAMVAAGLAGVVLLGVLAFAAAATLGILAS